MPLSPLKFRPRFVEKMWGGRKLETILGKRLPPGKPIGESWELYDFPPGVVEKSSHWVSSEIAAGPLAGRSLHWAVGEFGTDLHGAAPLSGTDGQFPVLIKFLDAREDLSVQVHPDQAYASANAGAHLKSEAWYVLQSDDGSRLLNGIKPGTTRGNFEAAMVRGDVDRLINSIPAEAGDCFYLPSGTVHALGAGILVAEVQTPSDTTFRVFDFNRVDPATGKQRELHVKQALQCIDFSPIDPAEYRPRDVSAPLVACPYFQMRRFALKPNQQSAVKTRGPLVLIVAEGEAVIQGGGEPVPAVKGEVVLLPAALEGVWLSSRGGSTWLEVSFGG